MLILRSALFIANCSAGNEGVYVKGWRGRKKFPHSKVGRDYSHFLNNGWPIGRTEEIVRWPWTRPYQQNGNYVVPIERSQSMMPLIWTCHIWGWPEYFEKTIDVYVCGLSCTLLSFKEIAQIKDSISFIMGVSHNNVALSAFAFCSALWKSWQITKAMQWKKVQGRGNQYHRVTS